MSPELKVFLLSMTPFGELRCSIPVALAVFHMPLKKAFLISFFGNSLATVSVLIFLEKITAFLSRSEIMKRFFEWLFERTRKKYEKRFLLLKDIALLTIVSIPLPFTGGWTGALCAFLFGIPYRRAIPILTLGIAFAGIITCLLFLKLSSL